MNRRRVLQGGAMAAAMQAADAVGRALSPFLGSVDAPVIDAHIHLFNPARPGGVPWPAPGDTIYRPALPDRFAAIAKEFGVVGAIAIEASPLAEDNDWLLDVVERSPVMLGMIGDLVPGAPGFRSQLDRLTSSPLFLGIRYGNLWNRNLAVDRKQAGFMEDLQYLAQAKIVFETANPDLELVQAALSIAERIPELTIVVDHLANAKVPVEETARREFFSRVTELGAAPRIYTKLSEVLETAPETHGDASRRGPATYPADYYKEKLDRLWEAFGPDKLLYGSDWPNSDHIASYRATFAVVQQFIHSKGRDATRKFFFKNSQRVYGWKPRQPNQQTPRKRGGSKTERRV